MYNEYSQYNIYNKHNVRPPNHHNDMSNYTVTRHVVGVEDLLVLSSVLRLTLGRYTCIGPACIVQCFEANSWEIYM